MPNPADNHRRPTSPLDAAIEHNSDVVRRRRKSRDRGFLQQLGLTLPVTVEDVKQAFYARAKETHPDHQGNAEEFREIQQAFDEALQYAERSGKRLPWLGAQLPLYVAQERVVNLVEGWGGRAYIQQLTWLEDSVGEDFAKLADRLHLIDLSNTSIGDAELTELFSDPEGLQYLETLNLAGTGVSDDAILEVMKAAQLRRLDLSSTRVSYGLRRQLARLPRFEHVEGVRRFRGWFRR